MNLRDLNIPKIGDTCTGINFIHHTDRNGMDCVVRDVIHTDDYIKDEGGNVQPPGDYFIVDWADGFRGSNELHNLKRKVTP